MNKAEIKEAIYSFFQKKMNRCEKYDEEKYRVYEMFLDWYPQYADIPDYLDDSDLNDLREDLWANFCDAHNINIKTAHFE